MIPAAAECLFESAYDVRWGALVLVFAVTSVLEYLIHERALGRVCKLVAGCVVIGVWLYAAIALKASVLQCEAVVTTRCTGSLTHIECSPAVCAAKAFVVVAHRDWLWLANTAPHFVFTATRTAQYLTAFLALTFVKSVIELVNTLAGYSVADPTLVTYVLSDPLPALDMRVRMMAVNGVDARYYYTRMAFELFYVFDKYFLTACLYAICMYSVTRVIRDRRE
jgi:hypothetical protein